jgi:RND superfamily putative drug exporter
VENIKASGWPVASTSRDATMIRALLVPALVSLFGRWNWVLPRSLARLLLLSGPSPRPVPAAAAADGDAEQDLVLTGRL